MFYLFDQNNSGGSFDIDDDVAKFVIIEANSSDEANGRAEQLGIYFNGVDEKQDCECCGDRWYPANDSDAESMPLICGIEPNKYAPVGTAVGEVYCHVHYLSGFVETHRYRDSCNARLTA